MTKQTPLSHCTKLCENSKPTSVCQCKTCNGLFHGILRITPDILIELCDRKLRDYTLDKYEIKKWEFILDGAMAATIRRPKLRRVV